MARLANAGPEGGMIQVGKDNGAQASSTSGGGAWLAWAMAYSGRSWAYCAAYQLHSGSTGALLGQAVPSSCP